MPQAAKTLRQVNPRAERYRRNTQSMYNNARWRNAAKQWKREHPHCEHCKPRLVKAYAVDHITPHGGNYELFWDPDNWQSLCQSCHNLKSRLEQG